MPGLTLFAPSEVPLKQIEDEIRGGLKNQTHLADSARSLAFYLGTYKAHIQRKADEAYAKLDLTRGSLFAQRIANVLTKDLYKDAPKRSIPDHEEASEWLENCYRANVIDSKWQEADRLSLVTDLAAFQAIPTTDARCPVRLQLWDASQLAVWVDPDHATAACAVAVIDVYDKQRRVRLWTDDVFQVWMSERLTEGQTAGGRDLTRRVNRANDLGFMPFSFVHFRLPVTDFWTSGLGGYLADVNAWAIHALTSTGESIEYNLRPVIVGKNIREGWKPPSPIRPGAFWFPPDSPDSDGESRVQATLEYLQADPSFVAASWDDIDHYLDHVAESTGTPKAALRMDSDSMRSGTSIAQEQAPLADWAKSRQRPFSRYEDTLAQIVLKVGARHLGAQDGAEHQATAAQLEAASEESNPLLIRWPVMRPELNGPERDQHSQFLIDHRLTSRVEMVKSENNMNDEEARDYLEKIADDLAWETELFADVAKDEAEQALAAAGKSPADEEAAKEEQDAETEGEETPK